MFVSIITIGIVSLSFIYTLNKSIHINDNSDKLILQSVDKARSAQVDFKKQVQEWKDLLIRGNNSDSYKNYFSAFEAQGKATEKDLVALKVLMQLQGLDTSKIDNAIKNHNELEIKYMNALGSYDVNNPSSVQMVDKMVKGIDRVPTDNIDGIVKYLQYYSNNRIQNTEVNSDVQYKIILIIMIGTILSIIMISLILGVIFVNQITKPLMILKNKISELAETDGDLTFKLPVLSKDEIGIVSEAFNLFMDKVRKTIIDAADGTVVLNNGCNTLTTGVEQANTAMNQIVGAVNEIALGNQNIAEEISSAKLNIEEINTQASETTNGINNVIMDFDEANKVILYGKEALNKQHCYMDEISTLIENVLKAAEELEEKSKKVNLIADTIGSIAEQTNLLALNASIEAARAGEQGKGFVVVAEEVKKLAEASTNATDEVSTNTGAMKSAVENTRNYIDDVMKRIKSQEDIINNTDKSFNEISKKVSSIMVNTKQAGERMGKVNDKVYTLNSSMQKILGVAEETAASTEQSLASAEEQSKSIENINSMVLQFDKLSQQLDIIVNSFKY